MLPTNRDRDSDCAAHILLIVGFSMVEVRGDEERDELLNAAELNWRQWMFASLLGWLKDLRLKRRVNIVKLIATVKATPKEKEESLHALFESFAANNDLDTRDRIEVSIAALRSWHEPSFKSSTLNKLIGDLDANAQEVIIERYCRKPYFSNHLTKEQRSELRHALMMNLPVHIFIDYFGLPSIGMTQVVHEFPERVKEVIASLKIQGDKRDDLQQQAKRFLKSPKYNFFSDIGDNALVGEMLAEIITPKMLADAFIEDAKRVSDVIRADIRQLDFLAKGLLQHLSRWMKQSARWKGWKDDLRGPEHLGCVFESLTNIQSIIVESTDPRLLEKPKYLPHFIKVADAVVRAARRKVVEKRLFKNHQPDQFILKTAHAFAYLEYLLKYTYQIKFNDDCAD